MIITNKWASMQATVHYLHRWLHIRVPQQLQELPLRVIDSLRFHRQLIRYILSYSDQKRKLPESLAWKTKSMKAFQEAVHLSSPIARQNRHQLLFNDVALLPITIICRPINIPFESTTLIESTANVSFFCIDLVTFLDVGCATRLHDEA